MAYASSSFNTGNWGVVRCPTANSVAWLECETFDACKITASNGPGMYVDKSFWGVRGWEVDANASTADACFSIGPNFATPVGIHHVVFANDVANGCHEGGIGSFNIGNASVDYIAIVGNVAYDAAQGSDNCYSGISIYQPVESDSLPGTHIYIGGNFSYGNIDPKVCAGGPSDGGNGIILDTFDVSQGKLPAPYAAQTVADNNLLVGNGAEGLQVQNNSAGSVHAPIYLRGNTVSGNAIDPNFVTTLCSEVDISTGVNIRTSDSLMATIAPKGCGGNTLYGMYAYEGDATDTVIGNFIYGMNGLDDGSFDSGSFAYGANTTGTAPAFTNPVVPGAPSCSGTASVPACMAALIANWVPKANGATSYGYNEPSAAYSADPLFPSWLCNTNLPAGLVSNHCP